VAITLIGSGIGLALAPRLTTLIVARAGWRMAMAAIGMPMLLLSAPAVAIFIRARPQEAAESLRGQAPELAGVDTTRALASTSFWVIMGFSLLAQLGVGAVYFHTIPYLVSGAGYTPASASLIFGGQALLFGPGALVLGMLADRFGPKAVLMASFVLLAGSVASLLAASNHALGFVPVILYGVLWGIDMGNAAAMPTLLAETFGMRRFGTISGLGSLTVFVGQGLGPIITGSLLDRTRSYTVAFEIAIALMVTAGVLTALVYPVEGYDQVPEKAVALMSQSG
jgi:predicted MFS family arabinose efflux permease